MKHLISYLLPLGTLLLSDTSLGQKQNMFLLKYKEPIQNYIMTGHEKGWKQCDILSDKSPIEGTIHISMELEKIESLNTKLTLASSSCLLVNYHVSSKSSLSRLLDFGRATFQRKRLALVIRLVSGMALDMAANFTKLPFLVAAQWGNGKRQFLCPVLGESDPRMEPDMCEPSYVSYKKRTLRIGMIGLKPYIVDTELGQDGIDVRMLEMLAARLKFNTKLIIAPSFFASPSMVSSIYYI